MSVDYNTYVGPYIKVHNPMKDSIEKYHTCTNKKCRNFEKEISSEYCSECGKKIKLTSRSCYKRIDFDEGEECEGRIAEALSEFKPDELKDHQFYIPNIGKIGLHLDANYTSVNPLEYQKPLMEVNHFQMSFSKPISRLKEVFGKNAVFIEWGVLVWQS